MTRSAHGSAVATLPLEIASTPTPQRAAAQSFCEYDHTVRHWLRMASFLSPRDAPRRPDAARPEPPRREPSALARPSRLRRSRARRRRAARARPAHKRPAIVESMGEIARCATCRLASPTKATHEISSPAGLLTPGREARPAVALLTYSPRLLGRGRDQWRLGLSFPVTAAGPFRIYTGFPILPPTTGRRTPVTNQDYETTRPRCQQNSAPSLDFPRTTACETAARASRPAARPRASAAQTHTPARCSRPRAASPRAAGRSCGTRSAPDRPRASDAAALRREPPGKD